MVSMYAISSLALDGNFATSTFMYDRPIINISYFSFLAYFSREFYLGVVIQSEGIFVILWAEG